MNAFVFHDLPDCLGDIHVFALNQPRGHLDDRHLAPKTPKHLSKLQPDVAAAYDHQMPRKKIDVHHRGIGEIRNLLDAGHVGNKGTPAHVDKNLGGCEAIGANANLVGRFEPCMASTNRDVGIPAQSRFDALS